MNATKSLIFLILLVFTPLQSCFAKSIAPQKNWRVHLSPAQIKSNVKKLPPVPGLVKGAPKAEIVAPQQKGVLSLTLQIPQSKKSDMLIVLDLLGRAKPIPVTLSRSKKADKNFKIVQELSAKSRKGPLPRIAHLTLPKSNQSYVQLTIGADGEPSPKLVRVRIYKLDKNGRNDYWLFLGASLTTAGCRPDDFTAIIRKKHKGFEPYVANEAVSGWSSRHLIKALPGFLKKHRHARYVAIHMGGNNVSGARPYPGGSKVLARELEQILQLILKAKKIPVLSRLSYRAYKSKGSKPAVPPETNGSGPYVQNIYDPLIRKYCRPFFDDKKKRGRVDFYNFYKKNQDLIGGDGIHLKRAGYVAMNQIWAERAGGVVYGS
ncbi:MAG: SGNH/GDSL hydrolase family protein [Planctomycetota bacterium]|nr:SGNH/GDSL hydrolase family protein [Planctomycetota bacterium]